MIFKRICAYLIDVILIAIAGALLANISYLNPLADKYDEVAEAFTEEVKLDSKVLSDVDKMNEYNYNLERYNIYGTIITITLTLLYFGVFQKYNNGQTLGKRIMKIKITGELNIIKYFIRVLILNEVFINLLKLVLILTLSKENYIQAGNIISVGAFAIQVAIIVSIVMREDNRGVHDLLVGSTVVQA